MPRSVDPGTLRVGPGIAPADSVEINSLTSNPIATGLETHLNDPLAAHAASAISTDDVPAVFDSDDVEGTLDELAALVPPRPPYLGYYSPLLTVTGIPDWGSLKILDAGFVARGTLTSTNTDATIYPYFHVVPVPEDNTPPFTIPGNDPDTDPTFNVASGAYTGGGVGNTFFGGYTRVAGAAPNAMVETARVIDNADNTVVLSGALYPADRGVLALLYCPQPGTLAAFTGQALANRCVAAILCGQGIVSGCDGEPGGIFTLGTLVGTAYNPFGFPGRATGQFDLVELHTGVSSTGGTAPPAADTAAGQVRSLFPILGGTTVASGGGNDNNFFRYRLPYMSDYLTGSGLIYTPSAEFARYYTKPAVSLNPGTDLTQAGDYANFPKDYWYFQLSRYRHRFTFPGADDIGSYILMHFRTEEAFEDLVISGTAPSAGDVYSANMVTWASLESATNVVDAAAPNAAASSYHCLRGAIIGDSTGTAALTFNPANAYDYSRTADQVMSVSGVHYFVPFAGAQNWEIDTLVADASNYWTSTYRMRSATSAASTVGMQGPNPAFLYIGAYTSDTTYTAPGAFGIAASQRVEFGYDHLDATSVHGAFDLANGPETTDDAAIALAGTIVPTGDALSPRFVRDTQMRMFFRRPVGHGATGTYLQGDIVPPADSKTVLFHTTDRLAPVFMNPVGAAVSPAGTETTGKDVEEQFLDEVYRYDQTFIYTPVDAANTARLVGPGLPGGALLIDLPVRVGSDVGVFGAAMSWIQANNHETLPNVGTLQVAGFPDRNPPVTDGVVTPFPSAGCVMYPQVNYSTGAYRPSTVDGDITVLTQPDFSAYAGAREYVRAFDVSFNGTYPVAGTAHFTLTVTGLQLADFAYAAPGPGSLGAAVMIKVPGLTTWMDAGRADGGGASKQDALLDGAGCQIIGTQTVDTTNTKTGIVECDVHIHVGAAATFFTNSEGLVPVLVKIILKDNATGKALNLTQGGPAGTSANIRGVCGLKIVEPTP